MDANFNEDKFRHYETYNVHSGAMESYLVSLETQKVTINDLNCAFDFNPFELIYVEYSYKYLTSQIHELAIHAGFEIIENFTDSKGYFIDSLWKAKK